MLEAGATPDMLRQFVDGICTLSRANMSDHHGMAIPIQGEILTVARSIPEPMLQLLQHMADIVKELEAVVASHNQSGDAAEAKADPTLETGND